MQIVKASDCYREPLDIREKSALYRQTALMTADEQSFILEFIKAGRPKKILEVGVSAGGNSALILHCIEMLNLDTKLYSVDIEHSTLIGEKPIGYLVSELTSHLMPKWNLYAGCTVARVIEEIGGDIDLCILDASHMLPGEQLDFLAILPYLSKDAVVVVHDIFIASYGGYTSDWNATAGLFAAVVAEKILLVSSENTGGLCNIGAFRLLSETKQYIENVFFALHTTWHCIPGEEHMRDYLAIIGKHYDEVLCRRLYQTYAQAVAVKQHMVRFDWRKFSALKRSQKSTLAIWGVLRAGRRLFDEMQNYCFDSLMKTGEFPLKGFLWEVINSIYFVDSAKDKLIQEGVDLALIDLREKSELAHDENLDAVIIGAQSEKSRTEILQELRTMKIPDEKIHFIEEFFDDEA